MNEQPPLFHVFSVAGRSSPDHPRREVKRRGDAILTAMDTRPDAAYGRPGRPGVPPGRLVKALLLMALYSIRSERQLGERIDAGLLFRWFLDLRPRDEGFDPTTFTRNRDRLEESRLTRAFFDAVAGRAITHSLCGEHFSVDGTLIGSVAAAKSSRPKGEPADRGDGTGLQPRNPDEGFRGQKRSNDTHPSRTDPEARLDRRGVGQEAKRPHVGHRLAESRHGLIVGVAVSEANGTAERQAAPEMFTRAKRRHHLRPATLVADRGSTRAGSSASWSGDR